MVLVCLRGPRLEPSTELNCAPPTPTPTPTPTCLARDMSRSCMSELDARLRGKAGKGVVVPREAPHVSDQPKVAGA